MKYLILLCSLSQLIAAAENFCSIQSPPILSEKQAILLEEKIMKTPPQNLAVKDVRRIVQYLIETGRETYESLMNKFEYGKRHGYTAKMLYKFAQGQPYVHVVDYLKRYYYETNNQSLVCPPPPTPESHWYDIFWSSRPSSGSSDASQKNDRTAAYKVSADESEGQPADDDHQPANKNSDKDPLLKKKD